MPGQFDESKHSRDGGKFSSKPGSGGEKKEDNTKVKSIAGIGDNESPADVKKKTFDKIKNQSRSEDLSLHKIMNDKYSDPDGGWNDEDAEIYDELTKKFDVHNKKQDQQAEVAGKKESSQMKKNANIGKKIDLKGLELSRFTKHLESRGIKDSRQAKKLQHAIIEERVVGVLSDKVKGFSERLDRAINEEDQVTSSKEAMKDMSPREMKVFKDFIKKHPERQANRKLSPESKATFMQLNDIVGQVQSRLQDPRKGKRFSSMAKINSKLNTLKVASMILQVKS